MVVAFFVAAWSAASVYPLAADADAQGRLDELSAWKAGGATPAQSRGPLHFYLLRLFVSGANPHNPRAALGDIVCGAGFLICYLFFTRRLFGEWIAIGSALALCFHPAFVKSAVTPSGFSLFHFLLFAGFWALSPEFDQEPAQPLWRSILAGAALSLSVFVRFEGGFFLLVLGVLLLIARRYRSLLVLAGAGLVTVLFFSATTYFSPMGYLRGGTLFIGFEPLKSRISILEFLGYLLSWFGAFPLAAGWIGAIPALKNRALRPWAVLFLAYTGMVFLTFLKTRFQHDLDRYYLYLLFAFLPFFGYFIRLVLPNDKMKTAGAIALAAYLICVYFYFGYTREVLQDASSIGPPTRIEEINEP